VFFVVYISSVCIVSGCCCQVQLEELEKHQISTWRGNIIADLYFVQYNIALYLTSRCILLGWTLDSLIDLGTVLRLYQFGPMRNCDGHSK